MSWTLTPTFLVHPTMGVTRAQWPGHGVPLLRIQLIEPEEEIVDGQHLEA